MSATISRPADIFSPTTDAVLPTRVSCDDAKAAGRRGYDKPTPQNSIVLLVDHQMGLMLGMRDTQSLGQLVANVVGLARTAKALGIPTLLTTSNAQWQNEDTLPDLKVIFPDQPIYRRTGIINCYEDPTFRKAIEDISESTGRRHIIIAVVTIRDVLPDADVVDAQRRIQRLPGHRRLRGLEQVRGGRGECAHGRGRRGALLDVRTRVRTTGGLEAAVRAGHVRAFRQRPARVRLCGDELLEPRGRARGPDPFG